MSARSDLPLKNDIAARFLPLIVALMVYLGSLCLVFTLFIVQTTRSWELQFSNHLTIEMPGTSSSETQAKVLALLKKASGVHQATVVPPQEMERLLTSLLGGGTQMDPQALPVLIDIALADEAAFNVSLLTQALKAISPQIQIIDDREWQHQVSNLIRTVVILASLLTFLILLATLVTTTFATRTSLLIHRQIIEVLHLIGATNIYISQQFQRHTLRQGLIAGTVGSTLACLTFGGVVLLLQKVGFSSSCAPAFFSEALCVFIFAPFITSLFMTLTTRLTVMRELHS